MEDRLAVAQGATLPAEKSSGFGATLLITWLLPTMALWAMAFFTAPASTPEWLIRAQAACFGTDSTGLPSAQGWTILILAPISLLLAMIVAFGSELKDGLRALIGSAAARTATVAIMTLLVVEGIWIGGRISEGLAVLSTSYEPLELGEFPDNYPRTARPAPQFELIDQFGEKQGISAKLNSPIILSFAFAHCTTVCPTITREVNQAAIALGPTKVSALLITLDPWRDTPGSLPDLAKRWELAENARVLSGEAPIVEAALDAYNIPRSRDMNNGDISHPPLVYIISADGNIAYTLNNPPRDWIVQAVRRLGQ